MVEVPAQPASLARLTEESLATLAHELRDPLATILLALETIICDRSDDPVARRASQIAQIQARRAAKIVDDLFDLCAGSRDRLPLRKEFVDLAEVVAVSTETIAHRLAARKHELTVSLPAKPVFLVADPLRLEQVLTNLLANVAKFTNPGGQIRLTADVDDGQVVLRVQDNGRGIERDLLASLFDLHSPAHALAPREPGGLGIGLALVKVLVELHGGSVVAFSDGPGAGAEFVVRLPTMAG